MLERTLWKQESLLDICQQEVSEAAAAALGFLRPLFLHSTVFELFDT